MSDRSQTKTETDDGAIANGPDCDDQDPTIHPDALETCTTASTKIAMVPMITIAMEVGLSRMSLAVHADPLDRRTTRW